MKKVYVFSFLLFIIDLISKIIIQNNLVIYQSITLIPNFFYITYVRNTGAAFSMLSGNQILLIILGIVVLIGICYYLKKEKLTKFKIFYYSLLLGGIVGNLFDRIVYNSVIDFLDFKLLSYDAPVFNIADCFIVIGVLLIIYESLKGEFNENRSRRK